MPATYTPAAKEPLRPNLRLIGAIFVNIAMWGLVWLLCRMVLR